MPTTATTLPIDRERAVLVGRAFVPAVSGAVLVEVRRDQHVDATAVPQTTSMH
jgi:fumarylacetoacetate (FAA) hydrolase family protein